MALTVSGAFFVLFWLMFFGNKPEYYRDVVYGISAYDSNKSAERQLIYLLALAGCFFITLFYYIKSGRAEVSGDHSLRKDDSSSFILIVLAVSVGTIFLIYQNSSPYLLALLCFAALAFFIKKPLTVDGAVFFICLTYAFPGLFYLFCLFRDQAVLGRKTLILAVTVCSLALLFLSVIRKSNYFSRFLVWIQLFIPFTLLVFLKSRYLYNGTLITIAPPRRISLVVWLLIIWFFFLAIRKLLSFYKDGTAGIDHYISFGTLCCIMNFNRFSGSGSIVASDLHHPFENTISWSQTLEYGQKLFSQYIPVSGLYAYLQGFFFSFFGKGVYSFYHVTQNLFLFAAVIAIIFLAVRQIDKTTVLFIALLVPIVNYNRVTLILPIMLLLSSPALIRNHKVLWLQLWFLSSLIHGLYYPVFGAAVCLAFLPLGIRQLCILIKEKNLKNEFFSKYALAGWAVCLIAFVFSIPLLAGTLRHILAMSSQTLYADGLARFAQKVPDSFFPYLKHKGIRMSLYLIFTFLPQAAVVWVSAWLALETGGIKRQKLKFRIADTEAFCVCLSFGITMLISFSYTIVRIDYNDLYARSNGIVAAAALMIIMISARYIHKASVKQGAVALAVLFLTIVSNIGFLNIDSYAKLQSWYNVPEDFSYVEQPTIPRLGICFMQQDVLGALNNDYQITRSYDPERSYLGLGTFGSFYLCELKGDSVMETATIQGYGAAQETAELVQKNNTIIFDIDRFANYYFYHWLLTSGKYRWSEDDQAFYPLSGTDPADYDVEDSLKNISLPPENAYVGKTPATWGKSAEQLASLFSDPQLDPQTSKSGSGMAIQLPQPIQGEDADFMFIEFKDPGQNFQYYTLEPQGPKRQKKPDQLAARLMKKYYNEDTTVIISWDADNQKTYSMEAKIGNGKLLIPLGTGRGWLLNQHDHLRIAVMKDGKETDISALPEIRFLKLREIPG